MNVPEISIIGPGKVGTAIGMLAARAGLAVAAVGGRTAQAAARTAGAVGAGVRACTAREAAGAGGLVLLTVPDDAVAPLCAELAAAKAFRRGAVAAHCSGALGSDALAAAREQCGCRVGSMHPLQTFPTVDSAVAKLPGAYFFIEGDDQAAGVLEALAVAIGGRPVRIARQTKALYHAAAVVACNYLTALLDAAVRLGQEAGIDRDVYLPALEPLVRATVDNVFALGPAAALTGPIERGDAQTLARHLAALKACGSDLYEAYRAMGRLTVDLASRKGTISPSVARKLMKLLHVSPNGDSRWRRRSSTAKRLRRK